jgi:hypothetical protein
MDASHHVLAARACLLHPDNNVVHALLRALLLWCLQARAAASKHANGCGGGSVAFSVLLGTGNKKRQPVITLARYSGHGGRMWEPVDVDTKVSPLSVLCLTATLAT